ncbi:16S rRNA (cytidine(1402)-2'-O)-methyltransferase [Desertibacillus haloalkaliphilus]|uniref:16S rRNA (cytidine(1402)-2'-O)-methyltransferase n=1 Tax=Desertibacillus haloalkaliphilus TaxID=1328930 RepID=UPI001C25D738|nr:16S rRNA (cytidine(1402)-2'-O)-methyltransferase [Desertibacillus haloalkaliphilus]MBU8908413.1 16S rRNA (cytidine(1402)-2'-O)-methyltransferase [Desertibacillus haloalkaliphilus]
MWQQSSYSDQSGKGVLYLVPTPVGNLEDMTYRAIRTLQEVDLIAAEDTRQTRKLCNHFEIQTKLVSYHEHNKEASGEKLLQHLRDGHDIALVSDAGMPAVSDPGYELVVSCLQEELAVVPLPGANAALPAIVASGLPTDQFLFYGFLHRQKKQKNEELEHLKSIEVPIIFYESPHRLKETLQLIEKAFGNRQISVTRELSKKHEEFIRGSISEVIEWCEVGQVKGEFCFVVAGASGDEQQEENWWQDLTIIQHVEHYLSLKMSSKDAIKQVARERKLPKREVYATYHKD